VTSSGLKICIFYVNLDDNLATNSLSNKFLNSGNQYRYLQNKYLNNNIDTALASDKIIQTIYHYQNSFTQKGLNPFAEGLDAYKINTLSAQHGYKGALMGRATLEIITTV